MEANAQKTLAVHTEITPAVVKGEAVVLVEGPEGMFAVRVIPAGGKYGLTGSVTAGRAMIEFYDRCYAGKPGFHPLGQFVARYLVDTLEAFEGGALALQFGTAAWTVTAAGMRTVQTLARAVAFGVLS